MSNLVFAADARYHHCMTIMSDAVMFVGFGRDENQNMEHTGNKIAPKVHQNLYVYTTGWVYDKRNNAWSDPIIFTHGREKPICGTYREPGSVLKVIVADGGQPETVEVITADNWYEPIVMSKTYQDLFIGSGGLTVGTIPRQVHM